MQDGANRRYRAKAAVTLDQVVQSRTFRNLLLVSFGIGFVGLAASIGAAALDEYRARADFSDRAYSSTFRSARPIGIVDLDSPPLLPITEPVDDPAPDIPLQLAVTTNDPALVIAGAAKSVMRQDGKQYRVTVTVETIPNESNERNL